VLIYLDDILIASLNEECYLQYLRTILQRLRQHGLLLNLSKCVFGQSTVHFLGHRVSEQGAKPGGHPGFPAASVGTTRIYRVFAASSTFIGESSQLQLGSSLPSPLLYAGAARRSWSGPADAGCQGSHVLGHMADPPGSRCPHQTGVQCFRCPCGRSPTAAHPKGLAASVVLQEKTG
jgi:hypothetical protein